MPSPLPSATDPLTDTKKRSRVATMLADAHFWTPVIVFLVGLAILAWVHE